MRIRAAIIDDDPWRGRGIAAALADGRIDALRHGSLDTFLLDPSEAGVALVADTVCRARARETIALLRESVGPHVLVYGPFECAQDAAPLFAAGANGCFSLSLPSERLVEAVRIVAEGKVWGNRDALLAAIEWSPDPAGEPTFIGSEEFRLLRLLEAGLTNKEIGQRLGFAESTVKARFNRLYRRFGVNSRVQLLTAALRRGILRERG
jgi:DNA-binding NarL/FixJ family response regulator